MKLIILKDNTKEPIHENNCIIVNYTEFKQWVLTGKIINNILKYQSVTLYTYRITLLNKPLVMSLLIRILSRGDCHIQDETGEKVAIGLRQLLHMMASMIRDFFRKSGVKNRIFNDIDHTHVQATHYGLNPIARPLYLRTELCFGLTSGGSIGHIAGVLNNLKTHSFEPLFITSDRVPTVDDSIETHIVLPDGRFWDFAEIPLLAYNSTLVNRCLKIIGNQPISFVYQRYSLNNYTGAKLAVTLKVPFVLEFNGSEVWITQKWGNGLKYGKLSSQIEQYNLFQADVIVVVSSVLKESLVSRGLAEDKILVNPNGVDIEKYHPEVNGSVIRDKYNLNGKTVLGFIGTFGPWHGVEVLAKAIIRYFSKHPESKTTDRFLLIGDGELWHKVRNRIRKAGLDDCVIFTGRIKQEEGPIHLAACDLFLSPHVNNSDGSRFFGSPTKLFEYMAMGRGIIASDLEQIGDVLKHGETGYLVQPGNIEQLANAMLDMADNLEMAEKMGKNARKEAENYTWKKHVEKIIQAIAKRCP